VASVVDLPLRDGSYDVVACFEVLEHIPWAFFPAALREIARVCRRYAIISLPDARRIFRLHIPVLCRQRLYNRPFWRSEDHEFAGEHYWEVNKTGYPLGDVIAYMTRAGFRVERTFRVWEMSRLRFFRLGKAIEKGHTPRVEPGAFRAAGA
jgi:SAM-dependent methyltransferase